MALINCPDCGKKVSDQAPTCPNCGRPLKKVSKPTPEVKVEGQREGCFLQTLNAGCFFTVVIIIIIILMALFNS